MKSVCVNDACGRAVNIIQYALEGKPSNMSAPLKLRTHRRLQLVPIWMNTGQALLEAVDIMITANIISS